MSDSHPAFGAHDDLLPGQVGAEEEGWLVSFLDVVTLILVLMVLLLSMSQLYSKEDEPLVAPPLVAQDKPGILPATSGLLPRYEALEQRIDSLALEGIDATPLPEGMVLRIADNLLFTSGQAELTLSGEQVISRLIDTLVAFDGEISVEGHSDNQPIQTGRFPSNWELSTARAIAVVRFLQSRGLPAEGLRAVGYADTRPVASNDDSGGRAANRRVELVLRELPSS